MNPRDAAAGSALHSWDARLGSASVGSLGSATVGTGSPHRLGFGFQGASLSHEFPATTWRSTSPSSGRQLDPLSQRRGEWERQIDNLDQEEMQIHQTQFRLTREQTSTFRNDLLCLRQEVIDIKAALAEQALGGKVGARLQEQAACIEKHMRFHLDTDKKLDQLKTTQTVAQATMKAALEKAIADSTAALTKRIEGLEDLGDVKKNLADKLAERDAKFTSLAEKVAVLEALTIEVVDVMEDGWDVAKDAPKESAKVTLPSLQVRLKSVEATIGTTTDNLAKAHSTVAERLTFLENCIGDSAEKHYSELMGGMTNVKRMGEHANQIENLLKGQGELGNSSVTHENRIDYLEKVLGDCAKKHDHETELMKAAHSRLQTESLGHSQLFGATTDKIEAIQKSQGTIENRFAYVERVIGDAADKNAKEVSALKAAQGTTTAGIRQVADRHVALQDRLLQMEKAFCDSADKNANDVAMHLAKFEQLHSKVSEQERDKMKHTGELSATRDKLAQNHATIEERLSYIEREVTNSFESHACELEQIKGAHVKLQGEGRDSKARNTFMEQRLEYLESWLNGFKATDGLLPPGSEAPFRLPLGEFRGLR